MWPVDHKTWWKHGVVYQIYPRSFHDSNGDGIGDIPGIIEKLDYLSDLGVESVWLSPVNTSPMHDFGYDICDYRGIDPVFGTMEDFERLIGEAHRRNIKLIMDMVMNHTSYLHPWFRESASSRDNPKRDWFIWRDGREGKPPNNWRSAFFGSAWEWHQETGQYYLHSFLREQPDVNWRNEDLRHAMYEQMRFWLEKGVDGFRLDVINWFVKDDRFRNNPFSLNPFNNQVEKYNRDRPEAHALARELRRVVDEYDDRMLVGEVFSYPPGNPDLSAGFLGRGADELHLAFDFSLMYRWWSARRFYRCIRKWQGAVPKDAWPCSVLSNHDQPRNFNRYSTGAEAQKRARIAAVLLLTLRGTPFMYYGEEIGMSNFRIPREKIADPAGKKFWPFYIGRDCARTPMQWSAAPNAGFTTGNVWLPVCMDYTSVNVEGQMKDRYSLLNFYKTLIWLRKKHKALTHGNWKIVARGTNGVLAYLREYGRENVCVALNFSKKPRTINAGHPGQWKVIFSTHRTTYEHFVNLRFQLFPYEASIIEKIGELK